MAQWMSYQTARPAASRATSEAGSTEALPLALITRCVECGQVVSQGDALHYSQQWVCATCKPGFLQKLKEGVEPGMRMQYAGFWVRWAAYVLDMLILGALGIMMDLAAGLSLRESLGLDPSMQWTPLHIALACVQFIIGIVYEVIFVSKLGATLGKMALGIQVVTAGGARLTYGRSLVRVLAKFLSGLACLIGYLMIAFDREKRGLHDLICDTRVIRKGRAPMAVELT